MSNNIISLSKEILDEMDECACACGAKVWKWERSYHRLAKRIIY